MPNRRRNILTVAEEMLKKITEKYIWNDKSWLDKYEPKEGKKCQVKRKK